MKRPMLDLVCFALPAAMAGRNPPSSGRTSTGGRNPPSSGRNPPSKTADTRRGTTAPAPPPKPTDK